MSYWKWLTTSAFFLQGSFHLTWTGIAHTFPRSQIPRNSFSSLCLYSPISSPQQGGAQISLAEVCRSGERSTRWYNLLSYKYLKNQNRESKPGGALAPSPGPESTVSWASGLRHPLTHAAPGYKKGRSSPRMGDVWVSEVEEMEQRGVRGEGEGAREGEISVRGQSPSCNCPPSRSCSSFGTLLDLIWKP